MPPFSHPDEGDVDGDDDVDDDDEDKEEEEEVEEDGGGDDDDEDDGVCSSIPTHSSSSPPLLLLRPTPTPPWPGPPPGEGGEVLNPRGRWRGNALANGVASSSSRGCVIDDNEEEADGSDEATEDGGDDEEETHDDTASEARAGRTSACSCRCPCRSPPLSSDVHVSGPSREEEGADVGMRRGTGGRGPSWSKKDGNTPCPEEEDEETDEVKVQWGDEADGEDEEAAIDDVCDDVCDDAATIDDDRAVATAPASTRSPTSEGGKRIATEACLSAASDSDVAENAPPEADEHANAAEDKEEEDADAGAEATGTDALVSVFDLADAPVRRSGVAAVIVASATVVFVAFVAGVAVFAIPNLPLARSPGRDATSVEAKVKVDDDEDEVDEEEDDDDEEEEGELTRIAKGWPRPMLAPAVGGDRSMVCILGWK